MEIRIAMKRGKDLIYSVFRHENLTNNIPWVPFAGVHAGSLVKLTATEVLQDPTHLFEALMKVKQLYHPDGQPIVFDLQIEAEILGCDLKWADKSPPMVNSHPLAEEPRIPTYIPQKSDGRLPIVLEVMEKFKSEVGDEVALFGLVCGPLTLASHLRGINFYIDLINNKEFATKLLKYCTKVAIRICEYYIESGMDIVAVVDPVVSQVSPRTFEEFLIDPFTEIFTFIRSQDVFSSFFVCGDATKNLEKMVKTDPDSIFVDENIDMKVAKEILSPSNIILGGNVPLTTTMLFGTQQDNMKYVVDLIENVGNKNLIIAPGCDMPYDTPPENVIGVLQAIQEPELIRQSLLNYEKVEEDIEIELPMYNRLHKPLVEIFTIDSDVCAACGYMLEAGKDAKEYFGEKIDLVEYKFTVRENIARGKKLQIKHLPCILINGEVTYSSVIPSRSELLDEISKVL